MENGQIQTWEQSEQDSLAAGLAAGASGGTQASKAQGCEGQCR